MQIFSIVLTGSAQNVLANVSLDNANRFASSVTLQSPAGNAAVAYYGDKNSQPMELAAAGATIQFGATSLKDLYVKGTIADVINVLIA